MPAFPKKKQATVSDLGAPAPLEKQGNLSARNNAQETPDEEISYHEEGGKPAPTPESVLYHGEDERCDGCEYFEDGNCEFLTMAVDSGGHCQRFEAKSEDQNAQPEEEESAMPMGRRA
jgi:hypothetical protein